MEYQLSKSINGKSSVIVYANTQLGKGAQAIVYRASVGGKIYAAKIFNERGRFDEQKIRAMIANPPEKLEGLTAGINYPRYSWPIATIEDNNKVVGYLMPLIDLEESFTLDHYYDKNLGKKLNSPDEIALSYRLEIAANLSALIEDLHSHGHYFIDFKPQNIRVFKRTHAVTLIDCDGFSIKSLRGKQYPAELLSTDYISPEAYRKKSLPNELTEDQDRYALAVIIFQLLNGGIHPFQGILIGPTNANTNDEKAAEGLYPHGIVPHNKIKPRPQSVHNCIDDKIRSLFDRAFMGAKSARPSAKEWAKYLLLILENKILTRCDKFPYDIRHIKFLGKDCPECQFQKNITPIEQPKNKSQSFDFKIPPNIGNKSGLNQANINLSNTSNSVSYWNTDTLLLATVMILILIGVMSFLVNMYSSNKSNTTESLNSKVQGPSFDCTKATKEVEFAICSNNNLAKLDLKNAKLYIEASNINPKDAKNILKYSNQERVKCASNKTCIEKNFKQSIDEYEIIISQKKIGTLTNDENISVDMIKRVKIRLNKNFESGGFLQLSADVEKCYSLAVNPTNFIMLRECMLYDMSVLYLDQSTIAYWVSQGQKDPGPSTSYLEKNAYSNRLMRYAPLAFNNLDKASQNLINASKKVLE